MPPAAAHHWQVPNRMALVTTTAREVRDRLQSLPISAEAVYAMQLAVEELLSNVVKYAYPDAREHLIEIRIAPGRQAIELVLEDDGKPFDPTGHPVPDIPGILAAESGGGLGIELVRRLSRQFRYQRAGDLNRISLQIPCQDPDAAPAGSWVPNEGVTA